MTLTSERYSKAQLEEMRTICIQNISFPKLVEEITEVRQVGEWYAVKCPFHQTKTFDAGRVRDHDLASGDEGVYWCNNSNCEVSDYNGRLNMFQFWALAHNFETEEEALLDLYSNYLSKELPEPNGNPLTEEEKKELEKNIRKRLLFLHVVHFYNMSLYSDTKEAKEALDYLSVQRKIPLKYLKRYFIGFAPGGNKLTTRLQEVGFTMEEIKESGLLSKKNNDAYWARIIVPLFSNKDNVLANNFDIKKAYIPNLYSRMIDAYITPENTSYKHRYLNRSFPLFNFQQARKKKYGVMVEGCVDVISAQVFIDILCEMEKEGKLPEDITLMPSQIGVFTSYGTNGFSEKEHLPMVRKARFDAIFIAGDHDKNFAGQSANIKRGRQFQTACSENQTQIRIVQWAKKDVNDMLKTDTNPVEFLRCLQSAVSLEEYEILVELEKCGPKEILRNQFEAINKVENLLKGLNLSEENSLLKYKKTILTLSDYVGVPSEDILLHVLLLNYKNDLKKASEESGLPFKTVLMTELSVIKTVFEES